MAKPIQSRPHRLPNNCYQGLVTVAFTCCIKNKKEIFISKDVVVPLSKILIAESFKYKCDVIAYIFMPNHCHILLQGKTYDSDTLRVIRNFKQRSGYWFSKNSIEAEWQKSFYDHILRSDEEIDKHMLYILENPTRKGMCEDWKQYPFKGSMVYDLDEWYP